MDRRLCSGLLIAAIAMTSACTSSGGGDGTWTGTALPPPASGPPVQLAQYCASYVDLACDTATSCHCYDAIGGNEALCRIFMADRCDEEVTQRVDGGAVTFNATRAGQCIAAMKRIVQDCALSDQDVLLYVASHCEDFLVGARRAGEPCDDDDECVAPMECLGDVCVVLPGPGAPCLERRCVDAAYCDEADVCQLYAGLGGPCAGHDYACGDDLYCDSRSDTCQRYIAAGGACDHAPWACDDDLRCADPTGVCAPYPGVSAACTDDGYCADPLYCDAASICRQPGPVGAACDDDDQCASDDCEEGTCAVGTAEICDAL
ncbi:MAG: hypothetical protein EP329_08475 [Deltaproteobacteria bacterium]|nr:MAG: hypothetical protein EP329_08475 [Deltaproteobacteria bacterium]